MYLFFTAMIWYLIPSLGDDKPAMDEVTLLATITMFLVWGPEEIAQTPAIQTQCVGVFKDCWGSKNPEVSVQQQ